MRVVQRQAGFTILEAVIAASLLLATCAATSGLVNNATRADGAAGLGTHLQEVLAGECERLAALPFSGGDVGDARASGGAAASLVSDVFPFARPELDTDVAYFVDSSAGDEAGMFVSIVRRGSVRVRREAVFVSGDGDEPGHLGPADLAGWDCTSVPQTPTTTLRITVRVSDRGQSVSRTLVLSALRPEVDPSPQAGN